MPWCGPCQRYFAPAALHPDGACPVCGEAVEQADLLPDPSDDAAPPPEEEVGAPWHFWVVVAATILYVGWRIVQLALGAL
ncbi:MAG: hypothetical protein OXH20_01485 [bacterium]|nr:hypothetical protein [bacterium]MXZ29399.1 hypothetical protein [Acidimicrobiia bacterium]